MKNSAVQPYLFFSGRCDEAIEFYQKTLGAELTFLMRYRESPDPAPPGMLPPGFEDKVMHASLSIGTSTVMVSDGCETTTNFAGFRLALVLSEPADVERIFAILADGGQVMMPPTKTFWSKCFAMVTDKFGLGWMLNVPAE